MMSIYDSVVKGDSIANNIHTIDINILSKLEQDLEPHELISLVFLLYEESHVAMQQVKLFERVTPARGARPSMDLLLKWAVKVQSSKPMWRYELLEALCICQLYSNIRKLNFDVTEVKKHFVPGNVHLNILVHPIKKVLYNICEGLTIHKLQKLKLCLETFNITCDENDIAEITFLQLICEHFISLGHWKDTTSITSSNEAESCNINDLANILKGIGCNDFASNLQETQYRINRGCPQDSPSHSRSDVNTQKQATTEILDFVDLESSFAKLLEKEKKNISKKIKTDATCQPHDAYKIKDPTNFGICYVINQVDFFPSKKSLDSGIEPLGKRNGSYKDRELLKETFTKLGFKVIIEDNIKHDSIKDNIRRVTSKDTSEKHSAFVLCILSHGIEGAIFGTDSVPVKVSEIQDLLNGDKTPNLLGIPKILLIQACQGIEKATAVKKLVPDGPRSKPQSIPTKSDLLTYWATVRGHSSYRDESEGTLFIQTICRFLQKNQSNDHLFDLFTKVSAYIMKYDVIQVPMVESTLRKKIYFINNTEGL